MAQINSSQRNMSNSLRARDGRASIFQSFGFRRHRSCTLSRGLSRPAELGKGVLLPDERTIALKVHDAATPGAAISGCPAHQGTTAGPVGPWLYSGGDAHAVRRRMRGQETLTRQEADGKRGFWNIVGFDDAEHVLRDTETFTSERGTMPDPLGTDDPAGGKQLAVTDPPRHTEMRTRPKKALAVKAVERRKDMVRPLVLDPTAPLGDGGTVDFAEAMPAMPMSVTGTMMGLPAADRPWLSRLTTIRIAADAPEHQDPGGRAATLERAHRDLFACFQDLLRLRRQNLGDDLPSVLISTEFEGRPMDPGEIVANCHSPLLGANVTTPHSPNHVMAEFIDKGVLEGWAAHPEASTTATEEALRRASPVNLRHPPQAEQARGLRYRPAPPHRPQRRPDHAAHPLRGTPHPLRGLQAGRQARTPRLELRLRLEARAHHGPAPGRRPHGPGLGHAHHGEFQLRVFGGATSFSFPVSMPLWKPAPRPSTRQRTGKHPAGIDDSGLSHEVPKL
ncbi:hypothetical protein [Streptomyces sp. NPDC002580]|uniref:hypothetical protein n=1 Tax=Streptomyces sp. NPDC002580 TaxID=3364653 RepID=UPI00367DF740